MGGGGLQNLHVLLLKWVTSRWLRLHGHRWDGLVSFHDGHVASKVPSREEALEVARGGMPIGHIIRLQGSGWRALATGA